MENIHNLDDEAKNVLLNSVKNGLKAEQDTHVYKSTKLLVRLLLLAGSGNLTIATNHGDIKASDNKMPLSFYFTHGSRILFKIPESGNTANEGDPAFNFLITGDFNEDVRSHKSNKLVGSAAFNDEKKIYFDRLASTHTVTYENRKYLEEKSFWIGVKSFVLNLLYRVLYIVQKFLIEDAVIKKWSGYNHSGVNLAISKSNDLSDLVADGGHGHLYLNHEPGKWFLAGIETEEPNNPNHSKLGKAKDKSIFGASKFNKFTQDEKQKYQGAGVYIPKDVNGMTCDLENLDTKLISQIGDGIYKDEFLGFLIGSSGFKSFEALHEAYEEFQKRCEHDKVTWGGNKSHEI